ALAKAIKKMDVPEQDQSDFLALRMLISCLTFGIVPAPWVADRFLNIINARYKKEIRSLDVAFGFKKQGQGQGEKGSELEKFLFGERNHWIGKSIWSLIILGDTMEGAISRVAKKFSRQKQSDLNKTVYDLQIINLLKKGADSN